MRINVDGRIWDAVASWGRRPTVDNGPPLLEVCLFDFSGDLYGKTVEVAFVEWIRPELKFDGLEALTAQIEKDCGRAREILAGGGGLILGRLWTSPIRNVARVSFPLIWIGWRDASAPDRFCNNPRHRLIIIWRQRESFPQ